MKSYAEIYSRKGLQGMIDREFERIKGYAESAGETSKSWTIDRIQNRQKLAVDEIQESLILIVEFQEALKERISEGLK